MSPSTLVENFLDLRKLPPQSMLSADVCVVGSGPAGLSVALQFSGLPIRVLIVESGGLDASPEHDQLGETENVGLTRAPHASARRRVFGGTSLDWTGRCAPFLPIDFQQRAWVPHSGWPITLEELSPHLDKAACILGLGPSLYDPTLWYYTAGKRPGFAWDASRLETELWQFSKQADDPDRSVHFGRQYLDDIANSQNIRVLLHASAAQVRTNADATLVQGVDVLGFGGCRASIDASHVVLACGGLENARLLLASNQVEPRGLGNRFDLVGRFLMDHPCGRLATFRTSELRAARKRLSHYWCDWGSFRRVFLHGIRLSHEAQVEAQVLNAACYFVENEPRVGVLNAARQVSKALVNRRPDSQSMLQAAKLLGRPHEFIEAAHRRWILHRPPLVPATSVDLVCNVEQLPDRDSRLTLSDRTNELGMRSARIDWRMSQLEHRTMRLMADQVGAEFGRLKFTTPRFERWLDEPDGDWRSLFSDNAHPMGTTRMSEAPSNGVVDLNSQVHGVKGLYIAGSSVFPTGGTANPTLMLVALSLRLADHLKRRIVERNRIEIETPGSAGRVSAAVRSSIVQGPVRVGLVGAGARLGSVYVPLLASMPDRYQVVGFTSRSEQRRKAFAGATGLEAFESVDRLIEKGAPQFLLVAVAPDANQMVAAELIGRQLPLLLETPIAWSTRSGRRLAYAAKRRRAIVGVAEQFPFLPAEQLKMKVIRMGGLGKVCVAHNDFATYDYHGLAQARQYLGQERRAVKVNAISSDFGMTGRPMHATFREGDGKAWQDSWTCGIVTYDDGALLLHHYSDAYRQAEVRAPRCLRTYGTLGTFVDDEYRVVDRVTDTTSISRIQRVVDSNGGRSTLRCVFVDTPRFGRVQWVNPAQIAGLTDEQYAIAQHLDGMRRVVLHGGVPTYCADQALEDIELLEAIRFSALQGGKAVHLPVRPILNKVRAALLRRKQRNG